FSRDSLFQDGALAASSASIVARAAGAGDEICAMSATPPGWVEGLALTSDATWQPDAGKACDVGVGRCRHDRLDPALRSPLRPQPAGDTARSAPRARNLRRCPRGGARPIGERGLPGV